MKGTIGYRWNKDYFNVLPEVKHEIDELSTISTSRYDPNAKKTNDITTFMKRPFRYHFNVTTKNNGMSIPLNQSYYYDKKEDCEKAHHYLRLKLYDQETGPFLKKINAGKKLSEADQSRLLAIMERMDKFTTR